MLEKAKASAAVGPVVELNPPADLLLQLLRASDLLQLLQSPKRNGVTSLESAARSQLSICRHHLGSQEQPIRHPLEFVHVVDLYEVTTHTHTRCDIYEIGPHGCY